MDLIANVMKISRKSLKCASVNCVSSWVLIHMRLTMNLFRYSWLFRLKYGYIFIVFVIALYEW